MMIKVCGMRDPENIRDVEKLSIDMMGFNFCKDDPRHVGMIASLAAIIPDYRKLIYEKYIKFAKIGIITADTTTMTYKINKKISR